MQVFFFKHNFTKYKNVPGRYAFQVSSNSLRSEGSSRAWTSHPFDGAIYADGYDDEQPGSNVDPNVFSDLLPWFLAYCLIDSTDAKRLVHPDRMLLPQLLVNEGALIVFGFVPSTHLLIIDTIICVSKVAELPQQGGRFALREGFDLFRKDVGLDGIDWATFSRSRCYSLNLIDSAPGGNHHRAFLKPHLMVIGRRCAAPPASIPGDALLNRFLDGEGFNCIPLASAQDSIDAAVRKRPGLFVKKFLGASSIFKHSITALSDQEARRLLQLVFTQADTLVLDPLEPRTQLVRTLPAGTAGC